MYEDNESDGPEREHTDWSDPANGADSWDAQFHSVSDEVAAIRGFDADDLREDNAFLADYETAFGMELGENHLHGNSWDDSHAVGAFLAEWYEMTPEEIDEWFGYDD